MPRCRFDLIPKKPKTMPAIGSGILQNGTTIVLNRPTIPRINEAIARLAELDLIPETALIGHIVHERHYAPETGNTDSQVLQAALLVPRGIGLVFWSTDEYMAFRDSGNDLGGDRLVPFLPWDELDSPIRALLFPHLESLLNRLIAMATPRDYLQQ